MFGWYVNSLTIKCRNIIILSVTPSCSSWVNSHIVRQSGVVEWDLNNKIALTSGMDAIFRPMIGKMIPNIYSHGFIQRFSKPFSNWCHRKLFLQGIQELSPQLLLIIYKSIFNFCCPNPTVPKVWVKNLSQPIGGQHLN